MHDIKLPEIGEGVNEGELLKWLVKEGDTIKVDQALVEILTDKASVEIPSAVTGTVESLKAKVGDMIAVGQTLMTVKLSQASSKKVVQQTTRAPTKETHQEGAIKNLENSFAQESKDIRNVLATPSTRRLAQRLGVDITQISGTGNIGRVTREDVEKAFKAGGQTPKQTVSTKADLKDEIIPLRGIRRKIAERMQLSKQTIPHFSIMDEANVTQLVQLRAKCKEHFKDVKITYLPFIMKALISACKDFPMLNASIDSQQIIYRKNFHIGFAADTPDGLLVPVIKNADQKTILQISQEIESLAHKAKLGKLTLEEMTGSTITITNIGSISGSYATPIINPPEVAIIGLYRIKRTPVFKDGAIESVDMMNLSCTADHRLIDGAVAARFLKTLIQKIETPAFLVIDNLSI